MQLLAVIDGQRMGFSRFGMYMLLFHCHATGGELRRHPLECADVGWFDEDDLPEPTAGASVVGRPMAFAAIDGEESTTTSTTSVTHLARADRADRSAAGFRAGSVRPRRPARRRRRRLRQRRRSSPGLDRRRQLVVLVVFVVGHRFEAGDVAREFLVLGDHRGDAGLVLHDGGGEARSVGAGVPSIAQARSTSAIAALGDGICGGVAGHGGPQRRRGARRRGRSASCSTPTMPVGPS